MPNLNSRARTIATKVGLLARKSRRRLGSLENYGEFMLVDPATNFPVAGFAYDMSAEEVIDFCAD